VSIECLDFEPGKSRLKELTQLESCRYSGGVFFCPLTGQLEFNLEQLWDEYNQVVLEPEIDLVELENED